MTRVYNDSVETEMTIDGNEWFVAEAEVELSQISTPNYVKIERMVPAKTTTFGDIDQLIGTEFVLKANNTMVSQRDVEEDNLLFKGALANISATGEKSYEGIAYDPSQEAFADPDSSEGGDNGSILNQKISIKNAVYGYNSVTYRNGGTVYEPRTIKASEIVQRVVDKVPSITNPDIQLTEGGRTVSGPNGSYKAAANPDIEFDQTEVTILQALDVVRESAQAEWWFDKEGQFHFGIPNPTAHELQFITDASDGKSTPPYQGVRVIGSGIASEEGQARNNMRPEERIVVERSLGHLSGESEDTYTAVKPSQTGGSVRTPVFEYRNNQITTDSQAENTAQKLIEDIGKQQAEGKVTVTGFPEIEPFDAIIMPHNDPDSDAPNYQENMPMGGSRYGVYKVVHRLNGSDGFKTIIHVSGLVGVSKLVVPQYPKPDILNENYPTRQIRRT